MLTSNLFKLLASLSIFTGQTLAAPVPEGEANERIAYATLSDGKRSLARLLGVLELMLQGGGSLQGSNLSRDKRPLTPLRGESISMVCTRLFYSPFHLELTSQGRKLPLGSSSETTHLRWRLQPPRWSRYVSCFAEYPRPSPADCSANIVKLVKG